MTDRPLDPALWHSALIDAQRAGRCAPSEPRPGELIRSGRARWAERGYDLLGGRRRRRVAGQFFSVVERWEGGQMRTDTLRRWMRRDYAVDIGPYSYGSCFELGAFPPSVTIGRYTSIGPAVRVFTQNHPLDQPSTHPYFYEAGLGFVDEDRLEPGHLDIGHDVWMGQSSIVLPGCRRIGNGAVIGANAVVTRDVPDFAIVAGIPAKVIRHRFDDAAQREVIESEWWTKSLDELRDQRDWLTSVVRARHDLGLTREAS
ncbi:MAG: CatB-related O-acetyltransferase [Planctomycetota bacterium]